MAGQGTGVTVEATPISAIRRRISAGLEAETTVVPVDSLKAERIDTTLVSPRGWILSNPPKTPAPDLGDDGKVSGAQTEAGGAMRELILKKILANLQNLRGGVASVFRNGASAFGTANLVPVFQPIPTHMDKEKGMGRTDFDRFTQWPDVFGFANGSMTAGMQWNIGTIDDEDLRAEVVGIMGNYSHIFLALGAASPFAPAFYSPDEPNPPIRVNGTYASERWRIWNFMASAAIAPLAKDMKDYINGRRVRIEHTNQALAVPMLNFLREQGIAQEFIDQLNLQTWNPDDPDNFGRDHPGVRLTDFGVELRTSDMTPTREEVELQGILAVGTVSYILARIEKGENIYQRRANERWDEHTEAAMHGMSKQLADPETGERRSAWAVVRDHLKNIRPSLALIDGDRGEEMYNYASKILDRLEIVGDPAARQRAALRWYRGNFGEPENPDFLSQDEGVFAQTFTLAQQQMGLFADPDQVLATAYVWQQKALDQTLTLADLQLDNVPEPQGLLV